MKRQAGQNRSYHAKKPRESDRGRTGGASASWHELLLYVVSRYCDPLIASALAKFLLLNGHQDRQAFCSRFTPSRNHGDGAILGIQRWLETN